jgi:hypothetical protein
MPEVLLHQVEKRLERQERVSVYREIPDSWLRQHTSAYLRRQSQHTSADVAPRTCADLPCRVSWNRRYFRHCGMAFPEQQYCVKLLYIPRSENVRSSLLICGRVLIYEGISNESFRRSPSAPTAETMCLIEPWNSDSIRYALRTIASMT